MVGSRFLCHSRRSRFLSLISSLMKSGSLDEFLRFGIYTLDVIACCMCFVSQSIARSIDWMSLVGRFVVLGKFVSKVLYFFQLMKRFESGGDDDTGVHSTSRSMGLWSEDSSLRLSI